MKLKLVINDARCKNKGFASLLSYKQKESFYHRLSIPSEYFSINGEDKCDIFEDEDEKSEEKSIFIRKYGAGGLSLNQHRKNTYITSSNLKLFAREVEQTYYYTVEKIDCPEGSSGDWLKLTFVRKEIQTKRTRKPKEESDK